MLYFTKNVPTFKYHSLTNKARVWVNLEKWTKTTKLWVLAEYQWTPKCKRSSWTGHHRRSGRSRQLDLSVKNGKLQKTNIITQNCEYSKNEYSQFWVFLFIFRNLRFFTERSNCLLLPDLLWCAVQELRLYFGVYWYSAHTHNFVVFVHFFILTHKRGLFVKEWSSVAKG